MDNITVSVSCLVFNHEKYLRRCLDGILAQKTDFKFEVLIHDDASTDSSAEIIREYEKKYPEIIRPLYQKENQYSQRINIHFAHQYPRARGKYFALCEGDDFWIDEYKLQKQVDLMEKNPDCSICVHKVLGVQENGTENGKVFPPSSMEVGTHSGEELVRQILSGKSYPFQTSSYLYVSKYYTELKEIPEFMTMAISGDVVRLLYLGNLGNVCYLDDAMSCYRMDAVGSWSVRVKKDLTYRIENTRNFIGVLERYDTYTDGKYHDQIRTDIHRRNFTILKNIFDVKAMKSEPYKALYKKMSFSERACYTMVQYLPFTKGFVQWLRRTALSR